MSQEQLQRKKSSKAFKNGFIGGLLGGAVAVAGGVVLLVALVYTHRFRRGE